MTRLPGAQAAADQPLRVEIELPLDRFGLSADFETRDQVTGVFGPSGSGKTSLIESIAGLRSAARGRIALGDAVWLDSGRSLRLPPERRAVGLVPQDGLLFPHLDVRANLLAGSRRARARGLDASARLHQVAELLEIDGLLDRRPATLSGGERQRVALGRALCSGPSLLLLDEPLAALDLPLRRRLLPVLRRVREEVRIPMLFISHDPIEVQALCDDLIALKEGTMIARGAPRRVLTDPEVYPLADSAGFENLLPCRILGREGDVLRLRLGGTRGLEMVVMADEGLPGQSCWLGLPAHEIILAIDEPQGLSARNLLPARLRSIERAGGRVLATCELAADLPRPRVEVTEATVERLGLEPGRELFLVIKATSCRLY